jgi:SAM-dependent methyltransferase
MTDTRHDCRGCGSILTDVFVDLGMSPLANAYIRLEDLARCEPFYPLVVYVCADCFLVQLPVAQSPIEIFTDYAYFSSYSETWLRHAEVYARDMIERFQCDSRSLVVEIGSNDGYLLKFFKQRSVPVLGIEPAANVARAAEAAGIPTRVTFFGLPTARKLDAEGKRADLLIANNVLAHVPDLHDFLQGMKTVLKPQGVATLEFPHLLRLMADNQFDTIYHEHLSYFSFLAVERLLAAEGLCVTDIEELPTHGGSLRVYVRHAEEASEPASDRVQELKAREEAAGFACLQHYRSFGEAVREAKRALLELLIAVKRDSKSIVGYGAPAKGNTLLNYCGIRTDFIDYTVDRSPHKQGLFLPGSRLAIYAPEKIRETRPDYLLILPWNLKDEIMEQMSYVREWGGQFIVPIPRARLYP